MEKEVLKKKYSPSSIYEQPFNERVRLFLRLESVFNQTIAHKSVVDQFETQMCLDGLFALLNVTNRYELRAELLRELERIRNRLSLLLKREDINTETIQNTLSKLSDCSSTLHGLDSKHIDRIRNIEFLNAVKNRNIHDTGTYVFELPELQYWLLQSSKVRSDQIEAWIKDFLPFKKSIDFLLKILRESAQQKELVASSGVYIKTTDTRSVGYQLLRVELLGNRIDAFPRVSGDKFRFAIRFMEQKQADKRPVQIKEDLPFLLSLCGI